MPEITMIRPERGPMLYSSSSENGKTPEIIIATGAVFSFIAATAVALRFYVRKRVTRATVGLDDWLMLASLFLTLGMGVMLIVGGALHALGAPTPQGWEPNDYFWVTDDAEIITEKIFWVFIMVQDLSFGLAKLSILAFYRRIIPTQKFETMNRILAVLVVVWSVGFFFAYLFRCGTQFWALWAPLHYVLEHCYDSTPMFHAMAISDVITDFFILSLHFFWILRLNMTLGKKLGVSGVFLLGATEIATGIARLVVFVQQTENYIQVADGIGVLTTMMFWAMIEMSIAIVAGCLPTVWPLISKMSPERLGGTVGRVTPEKRRWISLGRLPPRRIKSESNDKLDRNLEASRLYRQLMNRDRSSPAAHQYSPNPATDVPSSIAPVTTV